MKDLIRMAAQQGIRLHAAHLPDGILGLYDHSGSRIFFDLGLTPSERRSVVAHELGHAYYGHQCDSGANERLADAYAAHLLVDPQEYATLERISSDAHYIADELQVTPEVIHDFRRYCLQRLGRRTYPRLRRA